MNGLQHEQRQAVNPGCPARAAANELALQAIYYGESSPACINGQFLRRGQEIAGFVVERVEPTRVVLRRSGIEVALNLE